ncbi:desulfoferrodoxin family protein [Bacteroidota bacterium]
MKINQYQDISEVEKEAKKDYIDRHSPFLYCESTAVKNEKFLVKVKVGNEYQHPDDFDHYISYVQLWDRETMLAQATFNAGTFGSAPVQVETDFYIVPTKSMKLTAAAYCTKHGLWQSEVAEVQLG